ncbi:MAG: AIR synthase family protein [Tissierellia bacterium]|nr:AIR synthase family protein [Tissierellia bacterium]
MEIGKIPNQILEETVLNKLKIKRTEMLKTAGVGEDAAVADFGDNLIVMSVDPITGAAENIGALAVHISCNDIATEGAEPVCLLCSLLLPPETTLEQLEKIMEEMAYEADKLNVDIVGGHTEITDAVNRVVITTTVLGKKLNIIKDDPIETNDLIVVTKSLGLEGAAIIAHDNYEQLKTVLSDKTLNEAQDLIKEISVVKDGLLAHQYGAKYMHDITEGGVLGALWELGEATGRGGTIFKERLPIKDCVKKICNILKIDPLKLISSGSMLIVISQSDYISLQKEYRKYNIESQVIGRIADFKDIFLSEGDNLTAISAPDSDELYKV